MVIFRMENVVFIDPILSFIAFLVFTFYKGSVLWKMIL